MGRQAGAAGDGGRRGVSADLGPKLGDVWFPGALLLDFTTDFIRDDSFRVLMRLVRLSASARVWTYSAPTDGILPADERHLARLCGVTFRKWKAVRPEIVEFFDVSPRGWVLRPDWIRVGRPPDARTPLSPEVRDHVVARDSRTCRYCGTKEGPFDVDHVIPVSRGGGNDPLNLVLACQPCNRSKGAKLLREWRP